MLNPEDEPGFASDGSIATPVPYTPSSTTTPSMSHTSVIEKLRGRKSDRVQNADQIVKCPPLSERSQRKSAMDNLVRVFRSPWDKLKSDADKAHRSFVVADLLRTGITLSFTLNLSERRQSALKESAQPARAMSHEINRALKPISEKNGFKFPYGFVFEVSNSGKLHLHGFIVSPLFDETLIRDLDAALAKAGGHLTGKHQITKDSQNQFGWLYDGHGYFEYATKAKGKLRSFFGGMSFDQLVFVSDPMRRICRFQEEADAPGESDDSYQTYLEKGQKLLSRRRSLGVDKVNPIAKPPLPSISPRKEVFEPELLLSFAAMAILPSVILGSLVSMIWLARKLATHPSRKGNGACPALEHHQGRLATSDPVKPYRIRNHALSAPERPVSAKAHVADDLCFLRQPNGPVFNRRRSVPPPRYYNLQHCFWGS